MVKEVTKEFIKEEINTVRDYLISDLKRYRKETKISLTELLGRESLYRQKFLPVEISDIIENEILNEIWQGIKTEIETRYPAITTIPELQQSELSLRQSELSLRQSEWERDKGQIKIIIWFIRILRNEAEITDYPKSGVVYAFNLMKLEKGLEEAEKLRLEEQQKEREEEKKREAKKKELIQELAQKRKRKRAETTENKNEGENKEQRKSRIQRLEEEKNELIDNLKEAKEYAKDVYEWLPPKARYWVKIAFWIIVVIAVIWGFKYIIRGLKKTLRFLKWIWKNIVQLINEIKSLFKKEKKEGKSTTTEEKNNSEKVLDNPITDNKESKKLEEQKNKKNRRKNKRKRKKEDKG